MPDSSRPATVEEVLSTPMLASRPASAPRWKQETEAFCRLARELALQPQRMLQTLVEEAVRLCDAGSAGVSLLETQPDGSVLFRWVNLAGVCAPYVGGSTPRHFSPCGVCLDQNQPVLLSYPARCFTYFQDVPFIIVEGLVLPLRTETEVFGTIWILSHDTSHTFNREDVRVLSGLADLAAAALSLTAAANGAKQDEQRLALALEGGGGVGAWDFDVASGTLISSPRLAELLSVDPVRAAAGLPVAEFLTAVHPDDIARISQAIHHAIENAEEYSQECRIITGGGAERSIHVRGRCQVEPNGKASRFIGVVFDITERKRGEQALRASESLARTILDHSPDCIKLLDLEGRLQFVNQRGQELYGVSDITPFLGRPWLDFWHDPRHRRSAQDAIARALSGSLGNFEGQIISAHGLSMWWEVLLCAIPDEAGRPLQLLAISREITGRKLAQQERERLMMELQRSNQDLSQFSHIVAHDLQAPVRTIRMFVELLAQTYPDGADGYLLKTITGATDRMQILIRSLLEYAEVGKGELRRVTVPMGDAVAAAEQVCAPLVDETGARIRCASLPVVEADRSQMERLFQNLISNAIKYRRAGVTPEITITGEAIEEGWRFAVSDNGQGIPPQFQQAIFEPLKRLHGQDVPGSGLGLAVCRTIVERHGGHIRAETEPGIEGSTFWFTLSSIQ